jgi:leucyl-tRNA synthetase
MIPHITAELWEIRHPGAPSVHAQSWPVADPEQLKVDTVTMIVQVNGKLCARIDVDAGIGEREAVEAALTAPKVVDTIAGRDVKKVIARPPRLVNVVV